MKNGKCIYMKKWTEFGKQMEVNSKKNRKLFYNTLKKSSEDKVYKTQSKKKTRKNTY